MENNSMNSTFEYKEKFFEYLSNGDSSNLNKLISGNNLPYWLYYENDGTTSIIKSTFLNMTDVTLFLIDEAKKKIGKEDQKLFVDWINHKGDNGFNCLHYAAFRGNLKIIVKVIENGADIYIKNNNGLNVMHMAAQGDQPGALIYFKEKYDIKINCADAVMSSPLHWACYMGSETCVDYLTSWNSDLNAKDKDGFTPLHLAVMTGNILFKSIKKNLKLLKN
jgi:ankyrin repeat protein